MPINARGRRNLRKACLQNVPDECNLITVICLSYWGVDCVSPDKSKLEWKLHFLEWKSRSLGLKKLQYPNVHFSVLSPFFLLSFDLSLSCKLQLIDLITVFAAFLVSRQTILVSFFFRERRNRKETNGWKNKSHRNRTLQIHLSRFVHKIVCPVSKNAMEEWFFFYIILTPDNHANNIISRHACVIIWCPECYKWHIRASRFLNFLGVHAPRPP